MFKSSGRPITPRSRKLSTILRSRAAHLSEAGDTADRLLALLGGAAKQQVRDAFFGDDVRHVVTVNHHRNKFELHALGKFRAAEPLDEGRHHLFPERFEQLHHQFAPTCHFRISIARLASGLEPGVWDMAAAVGVRTHVRR